MASDLPVCMVSLNLKKSNSEKEEQVNLIKYQVRKNTSSTPFSILLAAYLEFYHVIRSHARRINHLFRPGSPNFRRLLRVVVTPSVYLLYKYYSHLQNSLGYLLTYIIV